MSGELLVELQLGSSVGVFPRDSSADNNAILAHCLKFLCVVSVGRDPTIFFLAAQIS